MYPAGDPRSASADPESEALIALMRRQRNRLWGLAWRTADGDPRVAEEALRDAYLAAMREWPAFTSEAQTTAWLEHRVVAAATARPRERRAQSPTPSTEEDRPAVEPPPPTSAEFQAAWTKLPATQRKALTLVYLQGYSVAEAAQLLGTTEGTIRVQVRMAIGRLRSWLGHPTPGNGDDSPQPTPDDQQRLAAMHTELDRVAGAAGEVPERTVEAAAARVNTGLERLFLTLGPAPAHSLPSDDTGDHRGDDDAARGPRR